MREFDEDKGRQESGWEESHGRVVSLGLRSLNHRWAGEADGADCWEERRSRLWAKRENTMEPEEEALWRQLAKAQAFWRPSSSGALAEVGWTADRAGGCWPGHQVGTSDWCGVGQEPPVAKLEWRQSWFGVMGGFGSGALAGMIWTTAVLWHEC